MPNSVIVGAGTMGWQHARASVRAKGQVVAVVDRDLQAAAKLAREMGECPTGQSLDEILRNSSVDVVHLCTPSATHADLACAVAKAGAHALIEKPVGETADELTQIAEAFAKAERLFCPVHQYAFQHAFEQAINRAAEMGRLVRFECDIRSAGGPAGMEGRDNCTADILPHPLSLMQRLRPRMEVDRIAWHLERPRPGEWLCSSVLGDGGMAIISISLAARPTCFKSRILMEEGEIEIDHFNGSAIEVSGSISRAYKLFQPFDRNGRGLLNAATNLGRRVAQREWAYPGLVELVRQFYCAISSQRPAMLPVAPEAALAVARTRDMLLAEAYRIDGTNNR